MSDEELEKVAGSNRLETFADGNELYKRGLLSEGVLNYKIVQRTLRKMGYDYLAYNDNIQNIYKDKNGNEISREDFWENFDAENGTKIIK